MQTNGSDLRGSDAEMFEGMGGSLVFILANVTVLWCCRHGSVLISDIDQPLQELLWTLILGCWRISAGRFVFLPEEVSTSIFTAGQPGQRQG